MNEYDVKRLGEILAIQAEIEGMKAFNIERVQNGDSPGYNEQDFMAMAEQLRIVVSKHNDNL
jgi:hypothetical protein